MSEPKPSASAKDASGSRGVVILGAPRSGTTLLRRLLDAHPALACPPETYLLSAASRFLHEDTFAAGLPIGVVSGLGYAGFPEHEVLARVREFVFGFLDDHAAKQGKSRWVEKTAFDAFHVRNIRRLCQGQVRFLCIHRHGLDVVCSMSDLVDKTGGYVAELHERIKRYPEPLEALARAWLDASRDLHALAAEDEFAMELRYEDLVADPEKVLREVLEFIGEPWDDTLIGRALDSDGSVGFGDWKTYGRGAIDASSVERWKSLPTPAIRRLGELCNEQLQTLGYDPVPTSEADADEARRRYELGLLVNRMRKKT